MSLEFEKAYLFTGVNGVGKSTLLRGICEKEPEKFRLFPGSLRLMEKLGLGVGDYDSLRKLPEDFKFTKKYFSDLFDRIDEQAREKHKNGGTTFLFSLIATISSTFSFNLVK